MRNLAIIPARSQSKGIKDKNIKILGHQPLLAYSIQSALQSCIFEEVMVSTDCENYAKIARAYGAHVPFLRSAQNSTDHSKSIDCILEVLECYSNQKRFFDHIVFLQPTSPFRDARDIKNAFDLFVQENYQALCSVHKIQTNPFLLRSMDAKHMLQPLLSSSSTRRRQDVPQYYQVNGAIYINAIKTITPQTSLNDNPIGFEITPHHGLDIDTPQDFALAEQLLAHHT